MKTSEIGKNAGIIWQLINEKGSMDVTSIKKHTKLDNNSITMALGWLARENNILFDDHGGKLNVTLKY